MTRQAIVRHLMIIGGAFFIFVLWLGVLQSANAAPPQQNSHEQVESTLAEMTLSQKVAQLFVVSLWGETLNQESRVFLADYQPGGVALFGYNTDSPEQITQLTNDIQTTLLAQPGAVPAWIAIDQEGGTVARLNEAGSFTVWPVPMAITATGNPDNARAVGAAIAQELRAVGITMNLAPVADLETRPDNPVIYRRAFGSDPETVGEMVAAQIEGMQAGGVLATAKHFPGHGDTDSDSHHVLPSVPIDRARLDTVELVPFQHAINANVGTIMVGHLNFPALDPDPTRPASLSPPVIGDLLRAELGYEGLVMTDALDMNAIVASHDIPTAAVLAIQAGADLITPGPHAGPNTQRAAIEAVIAAVETSVIPETRIDDSVRRILMTKRDYGLLAWEPLDPATARQRINTTAHSHLVADILAEAVTLVTDPEGMVPFGPDDHVALIYPATMPNIAQECAAYTSTLWPVGVSTGPTAEEQSWAVSAAQITDAAVVFTYDVHLNLAMQGLVRALPAEKTVVVALRSPYDRQYLPATAAYMATYSPLPAVRSVICAALFGGQPITGVLPVDLSSDLPAGIGLHPPYP